MRPLWQPRWAGPQVARERGIYADWLRGAPLSHGQVKCSEPGFKQHLLGKPGQHIPSLGALLLLGTNWGDLQAPQRRSRPFTCGTVAHSQLEGGGGGAAHWGPRHGPHRDGTWAQPPCPRKEQTTLGNDNVTLRVTGHLSQSRLRRRGGRLTRGCTLTPSHALLQSPACSCWDPNRSLSVPSICRAAETPGLSGLQARRVTCWECDENAGCRVGWEEHGGD